MDRKEVYMAELKNDQELLELAAKAAGMKRPDFGAMQWGKFWVENLGFWNPLIDDGDALRLAVALGMVIDTSWNGGANAGNAYIDFSEPEYGYQEGGGKVDRNAATRRAIVRAAAEIGRSMK
jgi:hypothetical protein